MLLPWGFDGILEKYPLGTPNLFFGLLALVLFSYQHQQKTQATDSLHKPRKNEEPVLTAENTNKEAKPPQTKGQIALLYHIGQLVTVEPGRMTEGNPLGIIEDGAVAIEDGKIAWVGTSQEAEAEFVSDTDSASGARERIDCHGRVMLPGLIDAHTHAIFAGDRADEFVQRLQGKSYQDIAAAGGGILKTVRATRDASREELYNLTRDRLLRMLSFGVTTVEVKSGYGLEFGNERKCLEVLRDLQADSPIHIIPTYMGAHDVPPEFRGRTDDYVALLCNEHIPAIAADKLAVFCDVFCEEGYFDIGQSRRILEAARAHGLKLKIHAEEFCTLGGAELAGELAATSAEHLLNISDAGIAALKTGGVTAVLLPGTAFFLRKNYAPARKILDAGVPIALATDFNPGSCMIDNVQFIMQLSCLEMGMTPEEAIRGVTLNAARALDLENDRGSISVGKRADLVLLDASTPSALFYHMGHNRVTDVFINGHRYFRRWIEEHLHTGGN